MRAGVKTEVTRTISIDVDTTGVEQALLAWLELSAKGLSFKWNCDTYSDYLSGVTITYTETSEL